MFRAATRSYCLLGSETSIALYVQLVSIKSNHLQSTSGSSCSMEADITLEGFLQPNKLMLCYLKKPGAL